MKGHSMSVAVVVCVALFTLEAWAAPARIASDCVSTSLPSVANVFPSQFQLISGAGPQLASQVTPTFAQDFQVTYYPTYKVVSNIYAGSYSPNETYVLYQCGTTPPPASLWPGAKFFSIPLISVSVDDASVAAFMRALGVVNRVSYTSQYAVDPCQQELGLYGCKQLAPSLYDTSANGTLLLRQVSAQVDALFTYGSTPNNLTISVTAAPDPGVLNRAEWIKYVSTFFNAEATANTVFTQVTQAYNSLKASVANAAMAPPTVAWVYYQPALPQYGLPAQWTVYQGAYRNEYTRAAGAVMISPSAFASFAGPNVTISASGVTMKDPSIVGQVLRAALANVTWVIDETKYPGVRNQDVTLNTFLTTFGLNTTDLQTLPFLRNGNIMRVDGISNPDGYTDWYENGYVRPDLVLQDLVLTLTPAAAPANAALTFMRKLGSQILLTSAGSCPVTSCKAPATPICPLVYVNCTTGLVTPVTDTQRCAPVCSATPPPSLTTAASPAWGMVQPLLMAAVGGLALAGVMLLA